MPSTSSFCRFNSGRILYWFRSTSDALHRGSLMPDLTSAAPTTSPPPRNLTGSVARGARRKLAPSTVPTPHLDTTSYICAPSWTRCWCGAETAMRCEPKRRADKWV